MPRSLGSMSTITIKWAQRRDLVFLTVVNHAKPVVPEGVSPFREIGIAQATVSLYADVVLQEGSRGATMCLRKAEPGHWPALTRSTNTSFRIVCDWDRWEPECGDDDDLEA